MPQVNKNLLTYPGSVNTSPLNQATRSPKYSSLTPSSPITPGSGMPAYIPGSPSFVEDLRQRARPAGHTFVVYFAGEVESIPPLALKFTDPLTSRVDRVFTAGSGMVLDTDQVVWNLNGEPGHTGHLGGSLVDLVFQHGGKTYTGELDFDKDCVVTRCTLDDDEGETFFRFGQEPEINSEEEVGVGDALVEVMEDAPGASGSDSEVKVVAGDALGELLQKKLDELLPIDDPYAGDYAYEDEVEDEGEEPRRLENQQEAVNPGSTVDGLRESQPLARRRACIRSLAVHWDDADLARLKVDDLNLYSSRFPQDPPSVMQTIDDWLEVRKGWLARADKPSDPDRLFITRHGEPLSTANARKLLESDRRPDDVTALHGVKRDGSSALEEPQEVKRLKLESMKSRQIFAVRARCLGALSAKWGPMELRDLRFSNLENIRERCANEPLVLDSFLDWLELRSDWLAKAGTPSDDLFITEKGRKLNQHEVDDGLKTKAASDGLLAWKSANVTQGS